MTGRARGPQNPMDPPPELRTLCLGTESLKPTRWVNVRNWRFVLWVRGQRRNMNFLETCWYWRWHFWGDILEIMYMFEVMSWRSFFWGGWYFWDFIFWVTFWRLFTLGVTFFGWIVFDFFGVMFHLSLASTPPPSWLCQYDSWSIFEKNLKICGCLSEKYVRATPKSIFAKS